LDQRLLEFPYHEVDRVVEPLQVQFRRGHWYLIAHDRAVEDQRTYRVDRIPTVRTGEPGGFERAEVAGEVRMRPWEYGEGTPTTVVVRLDDVAAAALRVDEPELELRPVPDGSFEVTLDVVDERGLFQFLVSFLDRAELVGPPGFRSAYIAWLQGRSDAPDAGADDGGDS
ncbi:MAG: WYL domain-containing protein, partial [Acidobacteria bacterium]|nr:WYL domain-containing protein [Acidobacteriota bacterium]